MIRPELIECLRMHTVVMAAFLSFGFAFAADYFVSPSGNDGNPGSLSKPWKTIAKANKTLLPGDVVNLRGGIYRETIRPAKSGTAGKTITYARYQKEKAEITGVSIGANLTNRAYIVLDGLRIVRTSGNWVDMKPNGKHCIIRNCHMEVTGRVWSGIQMWNRADHNRIIGNTFRGACHPEDLIFCVNSSFNLFEDNRFYYGAHQCIDVMSGKGGKAEKNIIRNNFFENKWHTCVAVCYNADMTLVENNVIVDAGEDFDKNNCASDPRHFPRKDHNGIQLNSSRCIIRNNVIINAGSGIGFASYDYKGDMIWCLNNRIYHNTFNRNYAALQTNTTFATHGNIFKNNLLYRNRDHELLCFITGKPNDNYMFGNNIRGGVLNWQNKNYSSLSQLQSALPKFFKDNLAADPKFVNEAGRDLHLKAGSPMIDAGLFLTKTKTAGTGKVVPVEDASYFMDGWGIVTGDMIQFQGGSQAKITGISYQTHSLTLDRSVSWKKGGGVALAYSGKAPDIGAFETGATPSFTSAERVEVDAGSSLSYEATFLNPGGGQAVVDVLSKPDWVKVEGHRFSGKAPKTAGADTLKAVLKLNGTTRDTLVLQIVIKGTPPGNRSAESRTRQRMEVRSGICQTSNPVLTVCGLRAFPFEVKLVDLHGRVVRQLFHSLSNSQSRRAFTWRLGRPVPSGIYNVILRQGKERVFGRLVML